jgi:hypothetical protein
MTKFLLAKPADQVPRVAKLRAASVVRLAKRPAGASETPLWNGSFRKTIAFGPDEHQNRKVAGSEWQTIKHSQNLFGKSQLASSAIRRRF